MKAPSKHIRINPSSVSKIYHNILNWDKRINHVMGGASSGKSYTMMLYALLWAIQGRNILICRQTLASMTDSTWADLKAHIDTYELEDLFEIRITERKIICTNGNKGIIILKGLEDPERIKSIRGTKPLDTIIVDEATEITEAVFNQLMIRQRGVTEYPKRIFLLYNPVFITHWIYIRFFKEIVNNGQWNNRYYGTDNINILKTTYRDNEFLSEDDLNTFEIIATNSKYHKEVYCDGNFGSLGKKIFETYEELNNISDTNYPGYKVYCGGDAGYTDPCTLVITLYNQVKKHIVVKASCGGVNLLPDAFASMIFNTLEANGLSRRTPITFDNNEPRLIAQLVALGVNIIKARKGQGTVLPSYLWLMTNKLTVNTTAYGIYQDIINAEWKTDKHNNQTDEPVHLFTHYIDGLRYSLEGFWSGNGKVMSSKGNIY